MLNSKELLPHTQNLNILFVEDHEELRVQTSHILKKFFNNVDVAANGEEALHIYKDNTNNYDIIISDIQMPKMNGVDLVENIYKINPKQIIIIVSAHDDTKYLIPLINLKVEQFIQKPIDYQSLLNTLLNASKRVNSLSKDDVDVQVSSIRLDDSFTFERENQILFNNKDLVSLTKNEIIFLQLLSDNVGRIYSNENITSKYQEVGISLDMANIRKLVSKLRKKVPEKSIESLYGVGYRMVPFL